MAFISGVKPAVRKYDSCSVITYIDKGWGNVIHSEVDLEISNAIQSAGCSLEKALYFIAFCWKSKNLPHVDLWRFESNPVDDVSGPLADMGVFQSGKRITNMGVASGNTLAVLGLDELHR